MTLSIAEALHQAQEAINGGDYHAAATTCGQLVGQFPAFGAAWQTLGEAEREQGNTAVAQRAYAAALQRNYRNPAVYLGLGLLAEEQGVPENALAFCQVAWELAPQQGHLREPLTRVALRRFGSDGDLQYSRAALAQLHVDGHRLRRAADEYRRALAMLPERVDLRLGLAECFWRMGQDADAATICRAVLEAHPEAGQALVILAEVEHRTGNARKGDELLKRLRAVDPDGALASSMAELNPRADVAWLAVAPQAMPFLSEFLPTAPVERPRIAPAPDFDYQPSRPEIPTPAMEDLAPISLAEFGASSDDLLAAPAAQDFPAFPDMDMDDLGITEEPFTLEALGQPVDAAEFDAFPFLDVAPVAADGDVDVELEMPSAPSAFSFADAGESDFAGFAFDMPTDPFEDVLLPEPTQAAAVRGVVAPGSGSAELDPATIDVTDLDLPAGVPKTGELTPSEAAGLGFEDFSGITEVAADEPLVPFDRALLESDIDAGDARHYDDTFDLSGFADLELKSEGESGDSGSQPDFPTMPLDTRTPMPIPAEDLRALSDFASVFDTPVLDAFPADMGAGSGSGSDTNVTRMLETPAATPAFPDLDIFDGEITDLDSLAASLEADIAGALARAGEPVPSERDMPVAGTGFTSMLTSIGAEGLAPFDHRGQEQGGFDMSSELDLELDLDLDTQRDAAMLDQQTTASAAAGYPPATMDIAQITQNWDSIDDEILQALPDTSGHGYTAELRALDDFGLAPFEIEGESGLDIAGIEGVMPFDPFSSDALNDGPALPILPDPASPVSEPFSAPSETAPRIINGVTPTPAQDVVSETVMPSLNAPNIPNEMAPLGEDDLLSGLQPFSFEEFDGSGPVGPVSGAKPGLGSLLPASWEAGSGPSAMPSDEDLTALLSLGDDLDFDLEFESDPLAGSAVTDVSPTAISPIADATTADFAFQPGIDTDHVHVSHDMLDLSVGDLEPFDDATIAVTRQLATNAHDQPAEPLVFSNVPTETGHETPSTFDDVPQRLTPGTELFTRARLVKQELMSNGVINGNRELAGTDSLSVAAAMDARAALEDATDTRQLPETNDELGASLDLGADDYDEYDEVVSSTGSTRDTTTLRAALEVTPNDDELRWWLAEALRERGDLEDAYTEYRWIIRHAPERHDAILRSLQECVERDQGPEMAHRLIGDIYRRRGDLARASNHATLALQVRRRAAVR